MSWRNQQAGNQLNAHRVQDICGEPTLSLMVCINILVFVEGIHIGGVDIELERRRLLPFAKN